MDKFISISNFSWTEFTTYLVLDRNSKVFIFIDVNSQSEHKKREISLINIFSRFFIYSNISE